MPDWKKAGKKAGKAYLTGGLSLAAEARKRHEDEGAPSELTDSTVDSVAATPVSGLAVEEASAAGERTDQRFEALAGEREAPSLRPDVEAAKQRMATKFGGRREIKRLDDYLWEDETVQRMATGSYAGKNGLVVLTDRRLIFLFQGLARTHNEDFPLDTITSIAASSGIALAKLTVFAAGARAEIHNLSKVDAKAIADEVRNRVATRASAEDRVSTPSSESYSDSAPQPREDVLAQIKQLAELKDSGVLTDEEFESKKQELLARL